VRRAALTALFVVLLAGCGEERTQPIDTAHPDAPAGERTVTLDDAGLTFTAPANWQSLPPAPPLEGGISSKTGVVAIWRYPRTEPLPANRRQLARAERRLVERIQERSATFALRSSELTEYDDARAIVVTGRQTIAGNPYDVRSTHVFHDGAEIVLDAYAPPEDFERIDDGVFVPLLDSLTVGP
jgi:hypothetical protein